MKILMLTPRVPYPPDRGDKIRSFAQFGHLARGHDLWLGTLVEQGDDPNWIRILRTSCRGVASAGVGRVSRLARAGLYTATGRTFTQGYFESADLMAALRDWQRTIHFDAVLAFSSGMAPYALAVSANRRVLDLVDADSAKWHDYARKSAWPMRAVYRTEGRRLRRAEHRWLRQFEATAIVNGREAAVLDAPADGPQPVVIPNGVKLPDNVRPAEDTAPTVGFIGVMSYKPNIDAVLWFADRVWPAVREAVPDARFVVVGRHPARSIRRLDKVAGISVTGAVPETGPYLSNFRACVAPLRIARGLQNKIVESLAWSRPVVVTPEAAEGIEPVPAPGLLTASTPEGITEHVVDLLRNPYRATALGAAGRTFVEHHYAWDHCLARLESVLTGGPVHVPAEATPGSAQAQPQPVAV